MRETALQTINQTIETHLQHISKMQEQSAEVIADIALSVIQTLQNNGTVYICGNGGSAADAQHIAAELVGRFRRERQGLAAVALSTDTSILTSIANDYGFEKVFSRQVEALVRQNDILWAISTSGESTNILEAVKSAKQKHAKIIAFTGKTDSTLEKSADICFCAEADSSAQSQEMHQLAYHIICDIVENNFAGKK